MEPIDQEGFGERLLKGVAALPDKHKKRQLLQVSPKREI
jgi:hypothetical protein